MISEKWIQRSLVAIAMLGILPLAGADDATAPNNDVLPARTIPSKITKASFMEPGIVREWMVKPGDIVKKGQLLGREDTDLEQLQLRSLRIQADSMAAIDAATADRDSKKVEYDRKEKASADGSVNPTELEEAKLDYEQREALLRKALVDRQKQLADVDIEARKIDKMQLFSPVDGTVKEIGIQEGEVVDPNKPDGAITLVTNNPLWVEVKASSAQVMKLKQGDTAMVAYQTDPNAWIKAKVIYLDPEIDAASDKEAVHLEIVNDDSTRSGQWVNVKLSSDTPGQ